MNAGEPLLRATLPRLGSLFTLALTALIALVLADLLIFHILIKGRPQAAWAGAVCWLVLVVMAYGAFTSARAALNPPVVVEADARGLMPHLEQSGALLRFGPEGYLIPWSDVESLSLETKTGWYTTGQHIEQKVIAVRLRLGHTPLPERAVSVVKTDSPDLFYVTAQAEPGGDELLRALDHLRRGR